MSSTLFVQSFRSMDPVFRKSSEMALNRHKPQNRMRNSSLKKKAMLLSEIS